MNYENPMDLTIKLLNCYNKLIAESEGIDETKFNNDVLTLCSLFFLGEGKFSKLVIGSPKLGDHKWRELVFEWRQIPFNWGDVPDDVYQFIQDACSLYLALHSRLNLPDFLEHKRIELNN